jgi:hypothetical protein
MRTSTPIRVLGSTLAGLLIAVVLLPTSALSQTVIFADFEQGGTDTPLAESGYGGTVTSDLTGNSDHVAEGDSAMVVTIDGDDTCSGGGCGFTGPYNAFNDKDVSPLDEDRMYLNMYMKTNASSTLRFKLAPQDENYDSYIYQPFALDPGEYRLVSIPYSMFPGDKPTDTVTALLWELLSNPDEDFQIYIDHITFTEDPYQPGSVQLTVFDDFEDGIGAWSATGGAGIAEGGDTPPNGGSTSLEITPSDGGVVSGEPSAIDVSGNTAPYLNMRVKRADSIGLEVTLADDDGDLVQLGTGNYTARTGSDFAIMSLPLSAFEMMSGSSGDGTMGVIDSMSVQTVDIKGSSSLFVDNISFTQSSALPVEIASFTGVADGKDALVRWTTASESNNTGFALLHTAPDAQSSREVTFVEGAGTTTETQQYKYRMKDLSAGTHRFQLRQVDLDGSTSYSDPVTVTIGSGTNGLEIVGANPFRTSTQVQYSVRGDGPVQLVLYDIMGRKVKTVFEGSSSRQTSRTLTVDGSNLSSGLYFLRLKTERVTKTKRLTLTR